MTFRERVMQFLLGKQVVAVLCNQFGDTGKGKFVDFMSPWADLIIRATGGANAGHTIVVNGKKLILHLIPSGILSGKTNVIARGVAVDLRVLHDEMALLTEYKVPFESLRISHEAPLVMPVHYLLDWFGDGQSIGTTGRGIGPCYSGFIARHGILVNDLFNREIFRRKLSELFRFHQVFILGLMNNHKDEVCQRCCQVGLDKLCYQPCQKNCYFDLDSTVRRYCNDFASQFAQYVIDTSAYVNEAMKQGKKILLEGAQGLLLSILYGTTQYQTSSDCSVEGLAQGAGIKPSDIDLVIGLAKAPYMTRVGNGPLPTEIDRNNRSSASEREEAEMMPDPLMYLNSSDPVALTRAIRRIGGEYGATTGRPRRIGWLDVLEIDHSCKINGGVLALTKLDVMTGREYLQVCTGYVYRGSDVFYAGKIIRNGDAINKFIRDSDILKHCEPVYHEMPGWDTPLSEITEYEDLPAQVKDLVRFIEDSVGCQVAIISVGPDREQVIFRQLKSDLPPALFAVFAG